MNRAEATMELIRKDRVTTPGQGLEPRTVQDIAVKTHDVFANALQVLMTPIDQNEYALAPRDGVTAGTRAAISSTLQARWFNKGNPLNLAAKVVKGFMEIPDGLITDALHINDDGNGLVMKTVA